jgi:hypothetical protein
MSKYLEMLKTVATLVVGEKDLVDLVLNGLTTHIKEKLEGYDSVNQVHVI